MTEVISYTVSLIFDFIVGENYFGVYRYLEGNSRRVGMLGVLGGHSISSFNTLCVSTSR